MVITASNGCSYLILMDTSVLGLMTLASRGQVDELAWADRIRDRLLASRGHAALQQPHDDPVGRPSLLS